MQSDLFFMQSEKTTLPSHEVHEFSEEEMKGAGKKKTWVDFVAY